MSDVEKIVEELNHVRYLLQGPATAQVSMDIAKSIDAVLPLPKRLEAALSVAAEALSMSIKYMERQRAKSNAPFDPEALKKAREALSLLQAEKKI